MPSPTSSRPYSTVGYSGNVSIDALVAGSKWGGSTGSAATVTYSFPGAGSTWSTSASNGYGATTDGGEPWDPDYAGLSAAQQGVFTSILAKFAEVANIAFTQVAETSTNVGDIRVAFSGTIDDAGYGGWAYYPWGTPVAGDVWLNPFRTYYQNMTEGSSGFYVLAHEIGHALGLQHSFGGDYALPVSQDSEQYSLMSYTDAPYATIHAAGPMLYDIQALQYIYGANMTTRAGDSVYTFSATTEELEAIWDAGGTDTFDLSNQTLGATLNLNAGTFSSIGVLNNGGVARDNIAIAYNVTIENANGGSGADKIIGNGANNTIDGNGGNDTLTGGGGNDSLIGDAGTDLATFSGSQSNYVSTLLSDGSYQLVGTDGTDILSGIELLQFGTGAAVAVGAFGGTGGSTGGTGGTAGDDSLVGTTGNDTLAGLGGNDTLIGNGGNDRLDGGTGNDSLNGAAGNDCYIIDSLGDKIADSGGIDTVETSIGYTLGGGMENLTLTGAAAINGTGGSGANLLIGNAGANLLTGNKGNDTIKGAGGDDTLIGGSGRDRFDYDALGDRGTGGEVISGFRKGSSSDYLDVSDLLDSFAGYTGANAFTGGYLNFVQSGTNTIIQVDADGGGDGYVTLVTIQGVALLETDTSCLVL